MNETPFARLTNSVFCRFILIGGGTAVLYLSLLALCRHLLEFSAVWSVLLAYPCAICFNYIAHYYWTYKSSSRHGRSVLRYIVTNAALYVVSVTATQMIGERLAIPFLYFQVVLIGVLAVLTYVIQRTWIFTTGGGES